MNIDTSNHNNSGVLHYTNMLSSIGCKNLTNIPTCFSETTRSILDHVVTSIDREKVKNGVLDTAVTDHLPTFALISGQNKNTQQEHGKSNDVTWQFINDAKKGEFLTSLQEKLEKINLSEHPEKILALLTEATITTIDHCFPPKKLSNKAKKRSLTPWYGSEIYEGDKKQSRLFRRFIKSKKPEDHQAYKVFRKKHSKQKYRAKRTYFRKLLRESDKNDDRSATWDVINKAFGKRRKSRIHPKKGPTGKSSNQVSGDNSKKVANNLNKHFASVAEKLAANLKKTNTKFTAYMGRENKLSMYLKEITIDEIIEEILKICIKKSMGYDNIPPKIIKWASDLFAPILMVIFNKCFNTGYYPNCMKIAKVIPIYKKGDQEDFNNYRPISILNQFNQIFERLISKRLHNFFNKYDLFVKKQFGFLKKHCTEHAILDIKEYIMNSMENQEITAVLFLDLQKAFDTVQHDILLKKLHHYGIRGIAYKLMSSYLSGRKQYTKIQKDASDFASILWGVPQGSVLGPLLFLIYINDLPNASSELSSWLFADDTALAMSSKNFQELEIRFNREVNKVQDWLLANGLSVHYVDKTQYMLIHRLNSQKSNVRKFQTNHWW